MAKDEAKRPVIVDAKKMWSLSEDRRRIRQRLPPLRIKGREAPLELHLEFTAREAEILCDWLCRLRAKMMPPGVEEAPRPGIAARASSSDDEPG